jgi:hypothetical protein
MIQAGNGTAATRAGEFGLPTTTGNPLDWRWKEGGTPVRDIRVQPWASGSDGGAL